LVLLSLEGGLFSELATGRDSPAPSPAPPPAPPGVPSGPPVAAAEKPGPAVRNAAACAAGWATEVT